MRCDVVVAGAGPAGSLAALLLARAGARVRIFDRARFPRAKLCGDTLNPGALRVLATHAPEVTAAVERAALPIDGMVLTGDGVDVRGTYGPGIHGRAITRQVLDVLLLEAAVRAGAVFEDGTLIASPSLRGRGVAGVMLARPDGRRLEQPADMVVAADGRESRLARAVGLTCHPARPRRWAIGGYFAGAVREARFGEMHVRRGRYLGVAPVPDGLTNACLVLPHVRGETAWRDPGRMLMDALRATPAVAARFADATLVDGPHVLGPMAVDARAPGVTGMVLAGDAAGFIDPITGDGLHFALAGGVLAAEVVGDVLAGRCDRDGATVRLETKRRAAFARKWHFNRAVRRLVAAPLAVSGATLAARVAPAMFASVIRYAGDCRA